MIRYRLTLAFNGQNYCGWQVQKNGRSLSQTVQETLEIILRAPTRLTGCSRTDAGVHANGYCALFESEKPLEPARLLRTFNALAPQDIRALFLKEAGEGFHPRYSAHSKTYLYTLYRFHTLPPREQGYALLCPQPLDVAAMRRAAESLLGEHDFLGFAAAGGKTEDTVRTLYEASLLEEGEKLIIRLRGSGFLYKMARAIAGTLLAVGEGRLPVEITARILSEKNHALCGETLPACGLTLDRVDYGANE